MATTESTPEAPELEVLMQEIRAGDATAVTQFAAQVPAARDALLESYGDVGGRIQQQLVAALYGTNELAREGLTARLAELRSELLGPNPSALEVLLVERVLAAWLLSHHADGQALPHLDERPGRGEEEKRQERVHRQFFQACKALAEVRRLLGINVQVNIAERQVNIQGGEPVPSGSPAGGKR